MANPLRAAEWKQTLTPERDDELITALCEMNLCCNEALIERTLEAYAAYLLSELEREFEAKLDAIHDVDALIHWASESAEAVAAFRKRVMGE